MSNIIDFFVSGSGSDGLLKLWTIKNNECTKTFDDHDDKVWAVTPTRKEDQVVTAGAGSTIMVWQDVTQVEYEEEKEKEEEQVLRSEDKVHGQRSCHCIYC